MALKMLVVVALAATWRVECFGFDVDDDDALSLLQVRASRIVDPDDDEDMQDGNEQMQAESPEQQHREQEQQQPVETVAPAEQQPVDAGSPEQRHLQQQMQEEKRVEEERTKELHEEEARKDAEAEHFAMMHPDQVAPQQDKPSVGETETPEHQLSRAEDDHEQPPPVDPRFDQKHDEVEDEDDHDDDDDDNVDKWYDPDSADASPAWAACPTKCKKKKCQSSHNGDSSTAHHNKDADCTMQINKDKCHKVKCQGCPGC